MTNVLSLLTLNIVDDERVPQAWSALSLHCLIPD